MAMCPFYNKKKIITSSDSKWIEDSKPEKFKLYPFCNINESCNKYPEDLAGKEGTGPPCCGGKEKCDQPILLTF